MDQSVASIRCNTEKENNLIFREERLIVPLAQLTH
jgi:hypothetical protein